MCNKGIKKRLLSMRLFALVAVMGCALTANAQQVCGSYDSIDKFLVCYGNSNNIGNIYEQEVAQERNCPKCHGKGTIIMRCHRCYGDGGRPCPTCNKKRVVPCACKGSDDDCPKCEGTGWRPCPNEWCRDGIEMCRACSGRGKYEDTCPTCYGRGIVL